MLGKLILTIILYYILFKLVMLIIHTIKRKKLNSQYGRQGQSGRKKGENGIEEADFEILDE